MLHDWSHDFAGYVINTVGLEDSGLSLVSLRIADWLSTEIFENSVLKSPEQIPLRVLQWFSKSLVRLFDSSTKSAIVYVFIVLLTDHRH